MRSTAILILALATTFGTIACGGDQDAEDEVILNLPTRARNDNLNGGQYRSESFDINQDGVGDQRHYFDSNGRMLWLERDLDFDGEMEFYEHYNAAGEVIEQELQLDFDPAIDVVRVYEGGVLVRKEMTTGFSGNIGIIQYFAASGDLLRVERDSDEDGSFDIIEYYEDGDLDQIGRDLDGDGEPDSFVDL